MLRNLVAPLVLVLVLAISVLPLGSPAAATTTLVVDDDGMASITDCNATTPAYPMIELAVMAAAPNDTIKVCPGTYTERVTIDKTLTLDGAQAGVDARTRPFVVANESVVQFPCGPIQIEADKVVFDGFTVQGSVTSPSDDPACLGAGIWTNPGFSGTQGGHQILNNIVQLNIVGIYLNNTCTYGTLVRFNLIRDNTFAGPASGNGIYSDLGLCNGAIDRNNFSGNTNSSVEVFGGSGITVTSNTLIAGSVERIVFGLVLDSSINGNISTGSISSGTIRLFGGDSSIMINSNTLLNGIRGIFIDDPFAIGTNTDVTAHQNCIQGNTGAGMEVDSGAYPVTPHLNATSNWWGSASGPKEVPGNMAGTGDTIIDPDHNVDFFPWLLNPPPAPCPQLPPPNTPGKATGGGKIQSDPTGLDLVLDLATLLIQQSSSPTSVGAQATFGLSVACCPPKGNLEYNDQGAGVRIKATSVTTFVISQSIACPTGKHAQFMGKAQETRTTTQNVTYTVDVDDCAEPGSSTAMGPDMFHIQTDDYMAGGPLIGGNIQIKQS